MSNIAQQFLHGPAGQHPSSTAIIFENQRLTYAQVSQSAFRAQAAFTALGLEWEQRVLLLLPDVPEFAFAWFGAVGAGGVVAAINPEQKAEEVEYYFNYTRAKIVVIDAASLPAVEAALPRCPFVKHVLVVGGPAGRHSDFAALLSQTPPAKTTAATHDDDPGVWLFTSGSTGFPKAAVHKHTDFLFNARAYALPVLGYREDDVCISVPRLAFGYALGTNLLFPFLAGATTVLFKEKPTPQRLFELIKVHRPTVFTAVPTALNNVLNAPELGSVDFSSFRLAISAGEALPAELYQKWKKRTGVEVLDGIGSAEMFHIFISNRLRDVRLGSLGRVVEGYQAKVCDEEGREVARGEVGTLWVSGDSMAVEYWQQRDKSKTTFRGTWCVSADKFQQDDEGYFYFCGRGDDMLKVSGKWLSPVEVENELLKHPSVREAAVVAFKDADGLDKPKAFVGLNEGFAASPALGEELKALVRQSLAPFKAPRHVVFVEALPRSDRGKVLKGNLRE